MVCGASGTGETVTLDAPSSSALTHRLSRSHNVRQHALRSKGPRRLRQRRRLQCPRREWHQDKANHSRCVLVDDDAAAAPPVSRGRLTLTTTRFAELELDEEGTRISLTVVDTPGFGDQIDNEARLVSFLSRAMHTCLTLSQLLGDCRLPGATVRRHSRRRVTNQAQPAIPRQPRARAAVLYHSHRPRVWLFI